MAFHITSRDIRLVDGAILSAKCEKKNKEWKESTIDLDTVYGNINGEFVAGSIFSMSSKNLSIDIDDTGVWLRAELADYDGHYKQASVRLDARITNNDGTLMAGRFGPHFCSVGNQPSPAELKK